MMLRSSVLVRQSVMLEVPRILDHFGLEPKCVPRNHSKVSRQVPLYAGTHMHQQHPVSLKQFCANPKELSVAAAVGDLLPLQEASV